MTLKVKLSLPILEFFFQPSSGESVIFGRAVGFGSAPQYVADLAKNRAQAESERANRLNYDLTYFNSLFIQIYLHKLRSLIHIMVQC